MTDCLVSPGVQKKSWTLLLVPLTWESEMGFLCAVCVSSLECDGERCRNPLQTCVISCSGWIRSRWSLYQLFRAKPRMVHPLLQVCCCGGNDKSTLGLFPKAEQCWWVAFVEVLLKGLKHKHESLTATLQQLAGYPGSAPSETQRERVE